MVDYSVCKSLVGKPIKEIIKTIFSNEFYLRKISDDVVCIDGCVFRVDNGVAVEVLGLCGDEEEVT